MTAAHPAAVAVWFGVVALCLAMYVLLDGYDLGIGIASLIERDPARRRDMVEIVATAWDGNESWLILLGVALWGGLPVAYGVMLPAVYVPVIVMLLALIFRGAAIELVSSRSGSERGWTLAFGLGSLIAALAQGLAIGGVLQGVARQDLRFTGGTFDFFGPLAVLTALATASVYAVAGTAYLQLKGTGDLERRARFRGTIFLAIAAPVVAITAWWTIREVPLALDGARMIIIVAAIVVAAGAGIVVLRGFRRGPDRLALTGVVVAEIVGLVGLIAGLWPRLLPPDLTVFEAAAPSGSLTFLLVGIGASLPFVMFYNWFAHRVFRGKYAPTPDRPAGVSATAVALAPDVPGSSPDRPAASQRGRS